MPDSVMKDRNGPDWPLGVIVVTTPGTPVGIMSLVDSASVNDPSSPVPGTAGANEYTVNAQQIMFAGFKKNGSDGLIMNTGNIYIVRRGVGAGTGNRSDFGAIVAVLAPGQTLFLASAPLNLNVLNPYRYRIDADNANDSALVTLLIQ